MTPVQRSGRARQDGCAEASRPESLLRAACVLAVLGLAGCATLPVDPPPAASAEEDVAVGADAPEAPPAPRPAPLPPAAPTIEPWRDIDWATSGAVLDLTPTIYDWDPDPFDGVLEPVRGARIPGEPLDVTSRTFWEPAPGYRYLRTVTAVDVGRSDAAGRRMAEQLLELATSGLPNVPDELEVFDPEWLGDPDCSRSSEDSMCAAARTEVVREDCSAPDGRTLRCFLVLRWEWSRRAHDFYWQDSPVFDIATGDRLTIRDLVPGVDLDRLSVLLADAIDALDEDGTTFEFDVTADLVPTPTGVWFRYDPYEAGPFAVGPRAVFLPYEVIARAVAPF